MVVFIVILWLLKNQLETIRQEDFENLSLLNPYFLVLSFALVFLNWYLEWLKWRLNLSVLPHKESTVTQLKAFMAGIVTGFVTPNMLGNFIGRLYYFQRRYRGSITLLTLYSNYTQFIASIFFGCLSLILLQELPFEGAYSLVSSLIFGIVIVLLIVYFFFQKLPIPFVSKLKIQNKLFHLIALQKYFRWKLLFLSLARHFVFSLQFFLVLNTFVDSFNFITFIAIWQVYLWSTLLPSLWLGKLFIRESMAILVLCFIGLNRLDVLISSLVLWQLNLVFPALVSLIFCRKKRVDV
jgi:uncharacterized membrane protein YbhN (UPF0104 family)